MKKKGHREKTGYGKSRFRVVCMESNTINNKKQE